MSINNGPIWNPIAQEYLVWLDGMPITWAREESTGWKIYNEARRVSEDHARKNPDESAWEWQTLTAPDKQQVVETLDFISFKICSWCDKVMGPIENTGGNNSHGICKECLEVELAKT